MEKSIERLQAHLFQPCTMLQTADTRYAELKVIEAVKTWNLKADTNDSKLELYYYSVIQGTMIYKNINSQTGELIFQLLVEDKKQYAGNESQSIKLVQKMWSGILNDLTNKMTESNNKYRAVVVLHSILEYPHPEIWYTIKWSIDNNYPISWVIISNTTIGINKIMDRYISYPVMPEIIDINAEFKNSRKEYIQNILNKNKIKETDLMWNIDDRINPMTIVEFNSMKQYLNATLSKKMDKTLVIKYLDNASKMAWRQLAKSSNLDLIIDNKTTFNDLGGLDILKQNMQVAAHIFKNKDHALNQHVPIPKAIILQGPQGTGKTETAKAIASEFGAKFIILNIANLFSGRVGDTEANFQLAINNLKTMAPVVVLVDEADKVLTGTQSSGQSDAGTTSRAMQTFTGFMAENHPGVFLVLTANDPEKIDNEFIRKGRVDDIYFVDIPSKEARAEIINIHLAKVGTNNSTIESLISEKILTLTENFTGAEIAEGIYDAKRRAYYKDKDNAIITNTLLVSSFKKITPLAVSELDRIGKLRKWGLSHGIPAESINSTSTGKYLL